FGDEGDSTATRAYQPTQSGSEEVSPTADGETFVLSDDEEEPNRTIRPEVTEARGRAPASDATQVLGDHHSSNSSDLEIDLSVTPAVDSMPARKPKAASPATLLPKK